MTVKRHSNEYFDANPATVAQAVRSVLKRRPPYFQTAELEVDRCFRTNVRPCWLLLGTEMTIRLEEKVSGTHVNAITKSQWFIMGDVFNYYNRYLRDFLQELHRELEKAEMQIAP